MVDVESTTVPVSPISRREMAFAALAAIVSMIVIGRLARDFWFRFDNFDLLADREITHLDDWLRPHRGHWLTWTVLLSRGLHATVGLDYWPWWYLPRLIGHAGLAFLVWWTVRHRGADRVIAAGAYAALLVLALSYFHDGLTLANYVVFPALIVSALLISEVEVPSTRHLVIMGVALLMAVMANGYGPAVLASVALVAIATRRFRRWAPALVPPAVIYACWYLWYRSEVNQHADSPGAGSVTAVAESSLVVVRSAFENTLGLPAVLAVVALLVTVGFVIHLFRRGRLDRFDGVMIVTLGATLGLLGLARAASQPGAETRARYGYAMVIVLTLLVVPHLPAARSRFTRVAVVVALVAVAVFNAVSLSRRLDERELVIRDIRADAEATGAMIAAGEPYVSYVNLGQGVSPHQIEHLVDRGWRPELPMDATRIDHIRTRLRIATHPIAAAEDISPGASPIAAGVDTEGCLSLTDPDSVSLELTGEGSILVDGRARISRTDRFGTVSRTTADAVVGLAAPDEETEVTLEALGPSGTTVCRLTPAAGGSGS